MEALEFVEMLATVDRQIAGLDDLLRERELPPTARGLVSGAVARWRAIREIIAKHHELTQQIKEARAELGRLRGLLMEKERPKA